MVNVAELVRVSEQEQGARISRVNGAVVFRLRGELLPLVHLSDVIELGAKDIVAAITTNETLFFRDESPFRARQHKAITESIDARENTMFPRQLRIWSAACSTGQEVYSIAMTLCDLIPDIKSWGIQIIGSDICQTALRHAEAGVYSNLEIGRGMPAEQLDKYFTQQSDSRWRVNETFARCASLRVAT